jgi:ATP-binding cassette, subfamily B, bacterial
VSLSLPRNDIPKKWGVRVSALLHAGEAVVASFEADLDGNQRYSPTLFLLTDARFLVLNEIGEPGIWPRSSVQGLRAREQHGLGNLQVLGNEGLLGSWRYTGARGPAAARFVQSCNTELAQQRGEKLDLVVTVCPSCGAVLSSGETECPSCAVTRPAETRSLLRLWRFARPHLAYISLGFVLTFAGKAAELAGPFLTMHLIDDVLVPQQDSGGAWDPRMVQLAGLYLLGLFSSALVAALLSWKRNYLLSMVSEYVAADLRAATYAHLQRLSLEFFGGKRTGDLISRVSSDSDRICNFLSGSLLDFVVDILQLVMTAVILFSIHPYLALVTLLPIPVIAWLSQVVRSHLRHGYALVGRTWSAMVSVLADTIPGIRVVKAFAQESHEVERFKAVNTHVVDSNDRLWRVWAFFTPVITLLTDLGVLVVWAVGAWMIVGGDLKVGALVAFVQYINRFYGRLDSMSRMLAATERTAAATHRIFEILDRTPSVAEPVKPVHPGRVKGHIELKGIRFAYGPREVIKGIDLTVEPGEMIGLVGPSGAGKSTLVNLVCRFFDVASGAIFVDGHDIRSFPIEEYRRNIGIVLQDPFLFYGTIAENIAYGRPTATHGEIIEAAKAAKAHEFILRLVDGYDSIVGERGQALSGGERQRISIARALLTDPRILILDEATSSVDTETEREIQGALDNLVRGRTTIAIAHRLSTLRNANRIVVVERGQITEIGAHEELLERAGTYARLHAVQQADPKAEF